MDYFDYYDNDPFERHDDYNVFEEREIMNDGEGPDDWDDYYHNEVMEEDWHEDMD